MMNTIRRKQRTNRIDRRTLLSALSSAGVTMMAGCLGSDDDTRSEDGDDGEGGESDDEADDDGDDDSDEDEEGVGTAEITFLDEMYMLDDVSCEDSFNHPASDAEQILHHDTDKEIQFWIDRHDPDDPESPVEVNLSFPARDELDLDETIGEVEAYSAQTTIDEIEFEIGSGTSGLLHLDPSSHMNDDVEYDPDGGEVEWEISC